MKRVATIVLNRNLPDVTDNLCEHVLSYDKKQTDLYVVEAGSAPDKLSRYTSWHAQWPEAVEHGLRYCRGMNYGLSQLWKEEKFAKYDAFFLLTNDTVLERKETIRPLLSVLEGHPNLGVLSPCSKKWGERSLLKRSPTKYFWHIHNNAYLLRRSFIESIWNTSGDPVMGFLFDGTNFRGHGAESELIAKGYANDWAAAITTEAWAEENESYLLTKADLIKTEGYEDNLRLYIEEGRHWMRAKYGFSSRWQMQQHVKNLYDRFFEFFPEYAEYKI